MNMKTHHVFGKTLAVIAATLYPITKSKKTIHDALGHVQILSTETGLRFVATDGHRLVVQDVDTTRTVNFPSWVGVIPDSKHAMGRIEIPGTEALRLAKILRMAKAKDTEPVVLRVKSDVHMLRIEHKLGFQELFITGSFDDALSQSPIGFNHDYLADALEDATSLEDVNTATVSITFHRAGQSGTRWTMNPIIVQSEKQDTFTVLMPVRL